MRAGGRTIRLDGRRPDGVPIIHTEPLPETSHGWKVVLHQSCTAFMWTSRTGPRLALVLRGLTVVRGPALLAAWEAPFATAAAGAGGCPALPVPPAPRTLAEARAMQRGHQARRVRLYGTENT